MVVLSPYHGKFWQVEWKTKRGDKVDDWYKNVGLGWLEKQ